MSEVPPTGNPGSGTPPPQGGAATQRSAFARAEQVYFEVAGLSHADRPEAVRRLCGSDEALQRQVQDLLRSAARLGAFIEQPLLGKQFDEISEASRLLSDGPDELLGATLGAFKIDARIASGGMGTVYRAHRSDHQYEQTVAIKVVKRGMDSEEILRRFGEERQTLANLDHPSIARLLDAGVTPDGRPYLVMEHIDGLPIDRYCDRKRLGTRDRLKLFQLVCDAVHTAHQSLIIHRDLKPGNILVTESGVPKLLDFGIAKVLSPPTGAAPGKSPITTESERRLTPEYASPEQVQGGPVTTASDVYSLGMVLYELLTGALPYAFALRSTDEVRRVVSSVVPPSPSSAVTRRATLNRQTASRPAAAQTPPDTDCGSAHAAEPPPDHPRTRGVSPTRLRNQLRGDVDNIVLKALRKEPARRYASAEQMSADIGRFLAGLPVSARGDTWFYRSRKFVRRHAFASAAATLAVLLLAAGLVIRSHQNTLIRRQAADLAAANHRLESTREFLLAVLSGAQTSGKGPAATLGEVLADASATLEAAPPDDPQMLASAQQAVGSAMMTLGLLDRARPLIGAAVTEFSSLPPESEARLSAELEAAQLCFYEGKYAESEQLLRDLLTREDARSKGVPTTRRGDILNALGASLRLQRKPDEALAVQLQALQVRSTVDGPDSLKAAESHNNIASAHLSAGRFQEAVAHYTLSLQIRRAKLRPGHPMIVATLGNLGLATLRAGDAPAAITLLQEAAAGWVPAFGSEHPGRVPTLTSLGQALRKAERYDESLAAFDEALRWQQAHLEAGSLAIEATRANTGVTLASKGECQAAIDILTPATGKLASSKSYLGITTTALQSLADCCDKLGRTQDADAARRRLAELK